MIYRAYGVRREYPSVEAIELIFLNKMYQHQVLINMLKQDPLTKKKEKA